MTSPLFIIVPVLNEQAAIEQRLEYLLKINELTPMIFVDGNSTDQTVRLLSKNNFNVVVSPATGRGAQLSYGVSQTPESCEYIVILHIDTQLPANYEQSIQNALEAHNWGRFKVNLDSNRMIYKIIEFMMNLRSKWTSIATGDQAIFLRKEIFLIYSSDVIAHPLMEDIFLSKQLKKNHGKAYIVKTPIVTSTRYWSKHGVIRTILNMWRYRFMYFCGISPQKLYHMYYR